MNRREFTAAGLGALLVPIAPTIAVAAPKPAEPEPLFYDDFWHEEPHVYGHWLQTWGEMLVPHYDMLPLRVGVAHLKPFCAKQIHHFLNRESAVFFHGEVVVSVWMQPNYGEDICKDPNCLCKQKPRINPSISVLGITPNSIGITKEQRPDWTQKKKPCTHCGDYNNVQTFECSTMLHTTAKVRHNGRFLCVDCQIYCRLNNC